MLSTLNAAFLAAQECERATMPLVLNVAWAEFKNWNGRPRIDGGGGMNINLHIERLVLDGVSVEPHQRAELKAAVKSELGRLLVLTGIGSGVQLSNSLRAVSGGLISIESNNEPSHIGQKVAGAVYRGIEN